MKIVKLQKIILSFAAGDTSKDGSLTGFSSLAQIIPFGLSSRLSSDSQKMSDSKFDCEIVNTSTVRVSRGGTGSAGTVIVYVAELDGDTVVQKGTFSTSNTSTDKSISSVSMSNSFVIGWWKSTDTSTPKPQEVNFAFELQAATNVRLHLDASGKTHTGHFYVITNSSLSVQRGVFVKDATPAETSISSVDLTKSYLVWTDTTDETQYEDEGNAEGHLKDATTIQFNPGYSSGSHTYYWQVISDSELVNVQRFNTRNSTSSSGNFTLSAVDLNLSLANAGHPIASNSSAEYDKAYDFSTRSTTYDITSATNLAWQKDSHSGSAVVEVISFAQAITVTPEITNADDELFSYNESGILLTGTDFGPAKGAGKVELASSSTYANATKVEQATSSWADTSIQFSVNRAGLTGTSFWLFVTHDSGSVSAGYAVSVYERPTITNVEDENFTAYETGVELEGYGLDNTGEGATLYLADSSNFTSATKYSLSSSGQSATGMTFDIARHDLSGTSFYLFVDTPTGTSTAYAITIAEPLPDPVISNIEDEEFTYAEVGIVIEGSNFSLSGQVSIVPVATPGVTPEIQTTTSWSDTEIVFNIVRGSFTGINFYLKVINSEGAESSNKPIIIHVKPKPNHHLYKTSNIILSITSKGLETTAYLLKDE